MVIDFTSCALRGEGLEENPQFTEGQFSLIRKDTENWGYVAIAQEKHLKAGCAGSTTGKELLDEFRRYELEAREQRRGLWGKST